MQRNWDCLRAILLALEDLPTSDSIVKPDDLPAWEPEVVSYNMVMLSEAGFIEAKPRELPGAKLFCIATRLTWQGHEFLDRVRSDRAWKHVRKTASDRALDLSFDVIKAIVATYAEAVLKGARP